MELFTDYIAVLKDWHKVNGKLELRPYLMFLLAALLFMTGLLWLGRLVPVFEPLFKIFSVVMIVPFITATIRRIHHVGKSVWFFLWLFIPIIGWLYIILHLIQEEPDDKRASFLGTTKANLKKAFTPYQVLEARGELPEKYKKNKKDTK